MGEIRVEYVPIGEVIPYANNARSHGEKDVDAIMASIREFGFNDPIGIWKGIIVEGHGRLIAAKRLGMETVPVIRLDHLTDEQRKAYALAHNKTAELSDWDSYILGNELDELTDIDMSQFGFDENAAGDWFENRDTWDKTKQEGNEEYNAFVEKFEPKKTTDDCYTPQNVYDAIADWVAKEYNLDRKNFLRPFYPGGDYVNEKYQEGCVVVDNPPFSILAEIVRFYVERGIPFFLFAPTLTLFSADCPEVCHICANGEITYENGAVVNTGFKTNLEDGLAVRTAPELTEAIDKANRENTEKNENLLRYTYPSNVITAAKVSNWGEALIDYKVPRSAVKKISALDAQKEKNLGIFGSGFLLSDPQAAKAAKAAKAAQEAGIPIEDINEDGEVVWKLSDREKGLIAELNANEEAELANGN